MELEKLKLLEKRIEGILHQHAAVCAERDRLRQQLGEAESWVQAIAAQLQEHLKDRAEIRAKVERILSRLDGLGAT